MLHDETSDCERDLSGSFCRLLPADKQTAQKDLKSALFFYFGSRSVAALILDLRVLYIYTLYIIM